MDSTDTKPLPKFFKDAAGFCYVATPALALQEGMTPWDGAVDANGFAADTPAVVPDATPDAAPPLPVKPTRKK